ALLVCVMLGVAVVVVLFGASSIDKPQSIDDLLTRIESDPGEKTMGIMLWPGARESWQAAQILARRLEHKGGLDPDEAEPVARRIIAILEKESSARIRDGVAAERGRARRHFLISALGLLPSSNAIDMLVKCLGDDEAQTRQAALQALARMRHQSAARHVLPEIYPLLNDAVPEVRIVACLTVASLADRDDAVAIREVSHLLEADREIQWNAAQALARMGSKRGKLVLMNMLDRGFWEKVELNYEDKNAPVHRKFTEMEVVRYLNAAVAAAACLDDAELKAMIVNLRDGDSSFAVREAARVAIEKVDSEAVKS
ncbi:MAG: HEAT repeat domain-containing protein, partial [Phycisphaerae bacterium]